MPDLLYNGTLRIASNDPASPREIGLKAVASTFLAPVTFASYEGSATIHGITELADVSDPPKKYRQLVASESAFRRQELDASPDVVSNVTFNPSHYTGVNESDTKYDRMSLIEEKGNAGGQFIEPPSTTIPTGLPWWMGDFASGSEGSTNIDTMEDVLAPAGHGYTDGVNWFKLPFTKDKRFKILQSQDGFDRFTNEDPESPVTFFRSANIGSTTDTNGRFNIYITAERGAGKWDDGWNIYVGWKMGNPPVGSGPAAIVYIQARQGNQLVTCDATGARLSTLVATAGSGSAWVYRRFGLPSDTSFRLYGIVAGEAHDHQFPIDLSEFEANLDDATLEAGGLSPWFYLDRSYPVGTILREETHKEVLVNEDSLIDAMIAEGGTVVSTDQWATTVGYSGGVAPESYDPIDFEGKTIRASFTMPNLTPLQVYTVKLTYEQRQTGDPNSVFLEDSIDVYPGLDTFADVEVDVIAPDGFQRRLYGTNVTGVVPAPEAGDGIDRIYNLLWEYEANEAGASYTQTETDAIKAFQTALGAKSYGENVKYVMPFFGSDVISSTLPIWNPNGWDAPTNSNFVDGDCSTVGGMDGDGSSKILTMPFKYSDLGGLTRFGSGIWFNDWDTSGDAGGKINYMWNLAPNQAYGIGIDGTNLDFAAGAFANIARFVASGADNTSYYGQKTNDTSRKIFRTGLLLNEDTTNDISTDMGYAFPFLFGDNFSGTRYNASSLHVAYYTDGGLSDANVLDLHNLIETHLITAVGR